jgi:hypothetical protein
VIVGLKILRDFEVEDVEELVKALRTLNVLDLTFEQVKRAIVKEFGGDYEDMECNDDAIDYVLSDLTNGNFYWEFKDNGSEKFTIYLCDPDNPFTKDGKEPKQKVSFT